LTCGERTGCLAARHPGAEGDGRREVLWATWVRELKYFQFRETELDGIPLIVARSGWSKQGGVELYLRDGTCGTELWSRVKEAGAPFGIGPGAPNDIERLESGLISYGADMRRQSLPANPFEMGFGGMIDLAKGMTSSDAPPGTHRRRRSDTAGGLASFSTAARGGQRAAAHPEAGGTLAVGHVSEIAHFPGALARISASASPPRRCRTMRWASPGCPMATGRPVWPPCPSRLNRPPAARGVPRPCDQEPEAEGAFGKNRDTIGGGEGLRERRVRKAQRAARDVDQPGQHDAPGDHLCVAPPTRQSSNPVRIELTPKNARPRS
jgi:hypothetical protein